MPREVRSDAVGHAHAVGHDDVASARLSWPLPPMRWLAFVVTLGVASFGVVACGDDAAPGGDDGLPDAGFDGGALDGGEPDGGPSGPPPVVAVSEPTRLDFPESWMRTGVVDGDVDPLRPRLMAGTFTVPTEDGVDALGLSWFERGPATRVDGGEVVATGFGTLSAGTAYWATRLDVPEGFRAFARPAAMNLMATPGNIAPGDPYAAGWSRVPLVTEGGPTPVVVRVTRTGRFATADFYVTPDEVFLNFADATTPNLRVGESDEQWLGVATLNLLATPLRNVRARVVENDFFEATEVVQRALPGGAVTQVAFRLVPKAAWEAPADPEAEGAWDVPVTVQVASDDLTAIYEAGTVVQRVAEDSTFRRTFRSDIDRSAQFYGVRPPADFDAEADYALVLSLHGAGVNARGQVNAYGAKDWAYIVAPTNRRPIDFDREAWGRLAGLEVLDQAKESYRIDETRVYVTGHSMGGHGTWQFGTLFPGKFGLVGPSAGWRSFYTYGGSARPTGPFARASASSDTVAYADNLERRSVFIVHGDADNNVPVSEARAMRSLLTPIAPDLGYHEEPGAGHWWDRSPERPGADCVDWPPMFERMNEVRLDPSELDFRFISPGPEVSPEHSFVRLLTAADTTGNLIVESAETAPGEVTVTTINVRGLELDGVALQAKGVTTVTVDGESRAVEAGTMGFGTLGGKTPEQHGPFNQALARPFCFIYPDDAQALRGYAGYLTSFWQIIGNGHACALPLSEVDDTLRDEWNLVFLGVPSADAGVAGLPFSFGPGGISTRMTTASGLLAFTYPAGEGLDAFMYPTPGAEDALFSLVPFTSRFALPDYLVVTGAGVTEAGFFEADWSY